MAIGALFGDWVLPIVAFLIGVDLVVFVHELGHFLAAKAVDIKVEKFAIGFGPKVIAFKLGETEYCLNILPLGGYVKMLGQDDVRPPPEPGKAGAAQAGDARGANPAPGEAGPQAGTDAAAGGQGPAPAASSPAADDPYYDPRAYQNKTVGQRMLVTAGGVVMNVLLGIILFVVVGVIGKPFMSPVLGGVVAGSPAARASITWAAAPTSMPATSPAFPEGNVGLRPGDRIVRIDGDRFLLKLLNKDVASFDKIAMIALLANDTDRYTLTFERQIDGKAFVGQAQLGVRVATSNMGTSRRGFGVVAAADTVLGESDVRTAGPLKGGDRIVSVAGRRIEHQWQIEDAAHLLDGNLIEIGVVRDGNTVHLSILPALGFASDTEVFFSPKDGSRLAALPDQGEDPNFVRVLAPDGNRLELPRAALVGRNAVEPLDILGMVPRLAVDGVYEGTPADKAGLQPGDVIYEYGDVRNPTLSQFRKSTEQALVAGSNLAILRDGKLVGPIRVTPMSKGDKALLGFRTAPDTAHTTIAGVREGSPAARAELVPGDVVEQVNGAAVRSWIDILREVRKCEGREVVLTVRRGELELEADLGEASDRFFDPADYQFGLLSGVAFEPLTVTIRKGPLAAAAWGLDQTWDFILTTYATLRQLAVGTVSTRETAGIVGVGQMAVMSARKGLIHLVYLMAVISATVAVINFLPFPVLDGGHATLLVIEKVRGRPLPNKVMWGIQLFGLICILVLFILLTWNDIARILHTW